MDEIEKVMVQEHDISQSPVSKDYEIQLQIDLICYTFEELMTSYKGILYIKSQMSVLCIHFSQKLNH